MLNVQPKRSRWDLFVLGDLVKSKLFFIVQKSSMGFVIKKILRVLLQNQMGMMLIFFAIGPLVAWSLFRLVGWLYFSDYDVLYPPHIFNTL